MFLCIYYRIELNYEITVNSFTFARFSIMAEKNSTMQSLLVASMYEYVDRMGESEREVITIYVRCTTQHEIRCIF